MAAATSAALAWVDLGLFWMAPGLVVAYALLRIVLRRSGGDPGVGVPAAAAAVLAGTVAGALLRPHPLATVELAWIQIVRLFEVKASGLPLLFGIELRPLPPAELLASAWSFLLLWVATAGAAVVMWRRLAGGETADQADPSSGAPEGALIVLRYLSSAGFLVLTLLSARRARVEVVVTVG